jgi:hypothetical protein
MNRPSEFRCAPIPSSFCTAVRGYLADDLDHAFYRQFAADGFRVYLYDQVGSGLSSRLRVRDYTLERDVADLEAIRQQIGADRLILIGHSWGDHLPPCTLSPTQTISPDWWANRTSTSGLQRSMLLTESCPSAPSPHSCCLTRIRSLLKISCLKMNSETGKLPRWIRGR